MAVICPNKNSKEFKDLVGTFGSNIAESLSIRNGEVPSVQEATMMLRGSKISQMKRVVNYLQNTTSNSAIDLMNNMFRIVQKVGSDYFVVKGSRIDENPAPGTEREIHTANRKFLSAVNESFGNLFNVEKISANAEADSLGKEIINDLKNGEFEGLTAMTYKRYANDPTAHDDLLKEVVDQATGGQETRKELEKSLGADLVNKALQYNEAIKRKSVAEDGKRLFSEPNAETKILANEYRTANDIHTPEGTEIYKLNTNYSKRIANAFDEMMHNPNDPEVKAAYTAMAQETMNQYKTIKDAGYKIELYDGQGEPYKNSSEMIQDVRDNKHLYVLSTEKEFGTEPISDQQRSENPLLRDSKTKDINGKPLLVNDVFRFVHDFFGHTERGNSFGPIGEENAWDSHARMYGYMARRAMTTETRGQNSWVNFGPHMRDENGRIIKKGEPGYKSISERPFAPQKIGLMPEEFSQLPEDLGVQRPGGVTPVGDTYRVSINQDALDKLASDNISKKDRNDPEEQAKALETNNKILSDAAPRYSVAYEKAQVGSVNHNVLKNLSRKFNLPFEVINDPTATWRGKFENGKVFINEAKVNEFTQLHEYLHPFTLAMQKDNPVCQFLRKPHVMRHHNARQVKLLLQPFNQIAQQMRHQRIDHRRRFVVQHRLRLRCQRSRDSNRPLHPR